MAKRKTLSTHEKTPNKLHPETKVNLHKNTKNISVNSFKNAIILPSNQMTPLEKMKRLSKGVSKRDLEKLKSITELDYDKLAKALSVTRATLINKKGTDKFNSSLGERIIGLQDIYSYGYDVFEDKDRFNQWMFRPNDALGGKTPYDVINNQFGREEVKNIIGRIDYGVYS